MKESSSVLSSAGIPFPSQNPLAPRALSAFEFCFGAFIVIGHNVFHIVPNEVIVLSVLGLISIRLRDGSWSAMGFETTSIVAADSPNCACRCHLAHSACAILNRTCDGPVLAEADPIGIGKRDTGNVKVAVGCFVARVGICRFRRKDCISRISPEACS
jgi:hypothetical protein